MFEQLQKKFAAALLDPDRPLPPMLTSYTARRPEKRFAVYRNNVVVSLLNALANRFPATRRTVGEDFFRNMARVYVAARPPRSPLLMIFGDDFPGFIAGFAPAKPLEYLADVAWLEAARTRVYHAADAVPIDPTRLRAVQEHALAGLRFVRHPAAEIVRSAHPVVTIWGMNSGEIELGPIEGWRGEDALVARPALEVFVRALPAGGATFLATLFAGARLADAAEAAQAENEDFDLAANLVGLISAGVVTEVSLDSD